jgi:hypothetical protein
MSLIDRLHKGDELHREAAAALEHFGLFSEFVLSDTKMGLAFVKWQRTKGSVSEAPDA